MAVLVVPANFGVNREAIALTGECEQNSYLPSGLQGGGFSYSHAALADIHQTATGFLAIGQDHCRNRNRTTEGAAAFPHDQSE